MKSHSLFMIGAAALGLAGCFGTETGNPPVAASLTVRSSDPSVAVAPATGDVVIDEGWVSFRAVRVVLGETCDHVSDALDTDVVGDVTSGVSLDGLPSGEICGVHLAPAPPPTLPAGAPPGLAERALFVTGRLGDGTRFELSIESAVGIDVVGATPSTLPDGGAVWLAFDVAAWIAALDLGALPPDADGVIRIGPGDPEIGALEAGYNGSIGLYRDAGDDGVFDSAEESAGPIATSGHP